MICNEKKVSHGLPILNSNLFIVSARRDGCCFEFIVLANSDIDAIARVKANATAVIEEVRKTMAPADMEVVSLYADPSFDVSRRIADYEEGIRRMNESLDELEDREDELAISKRETITEEIQANYAAIRKLRTPTEVGKASKFEIVTERMRELLMEHTKFTAKKLPGDRCFPVAYFDDSRSITNYCE